MPIRLAAGFFLILILAAPSRAHDFWLQPDSFFPKLNTAVPVRLLVGDGFDSDDERPYLKKLTQRFALVGGDKTMDLAGLAAEGKKPLVSVQFDKPGSYWLVLDRDWAYLTLEVKKFNAYLKEEGLLHVLKERAMANQTSLPGKERYRRNLKCLLHAGDKTDDTWKQSVQQQLEILPLADPAALKPGEMMRVKVLFGAKPLPGAALFAFGKSKGDVTKRSLQTDKDGIAAFKLTSTGPWLVRLVHMRRCADDARADWESFWSAFTFEIKALE